ncbi:hypothetical protein [Streptomyces nanshensis]|uniref:hypothetical protein n=1 Tax=Streptomyces nanshensis TaxID=518642 RepID=UPI00114CDC61|nr:hypothetical protein [Streptomyces nanshensis]
MANKKNTVRAAKSSIRRGKQEGPASQQQGAIVDRHIRAHPEHSHMSAEEKDTPQYTRRFQRREGK